MFNGLAHRLAELRSPLPSTIRASLNFRADLLQRTAGRKAAGGALRDPAYVHRLFVVAFPSETLDQANAIRSVFAETRGERSSAFWAQRRRGCRNGRPDSTPAKAKFNCSQRRGTLDNRHRQSRRHRLRHQTGPQPQTGGSLRSCGVAQQHAAVSHFDNNSRRKPRRDNAVPRPYSSFALGTWRLSTFTKGERFIFRT